MSSRARDVAEAARARAGDAGTTLVAVDGAGGSGKTTLAATASELLDGSGCAITFWRRCGPGAGSLSAVRPGHR